MRAVLINSSGVVANAITVGVGYTPPNGYTLVASDTANIGDTYNSNFGTFTAPPAPPDPPVPVPGSVTRRQMLLGLSQAGYITSQEAIAAAQTGAVPFAVQSVFVGLPDQASRDAATVTWAAMNNCLRSDPLVAALAQSKGLTDAQVDDLFREWVAL